MEPNPPRLTVAPLRAAEIDAGRAVIALIREGDNEVPCGVTTLAYEAARESSERYACPYDDIGAEYTVPPRAT